MKNAATDANIGGPVAGTGANLTIPTGNLTATTQYKVVATRTDVTPNCEIVLTDKPTVTVNNDLSIVASVDDNDICLGECITLSSTPCRRHHQLQLHLERSRRFQQRSRRSRLLHTCIIRHSPYLLRHRGRRFQPVVAAAPARPPIMSRWMSLTRLPMASHLSIHHLREHQPGAER